MKKIYVSLNLGLDFKQIFMISYTRDGGFFIKDLIRVTASDKKCLILKFASDTNNHGIREVPLSYTAFTSGEAKLTHHFDGNAQISGVGVLSGYEADGTPKGASIKSFPLTSVNDGGSIFTFLTWGCNHSFRNAKQTDIILTPDFQYTHSLDPNEELNCYVVKGFYILKDYIRPNNPIPSKVIYDSPIDGKMELTIVPSPPDIPGVIGLVALPEHHGFKDKFGFTLQGAPGVIYDDHFCDVLGIIYPHQGSLQDCIDLDYHSKS